MLIGTGLLLGIDHECNIVFRLTMDDGKLQKFKGIIRIFEKGSQKFEDVEIVLAGCTGGVSIRGESQTISNGRQDLTCGAEIVKEDLAESQSKVPDYIPEKNHKPIISDEYNFKPQTDDKSSVAQTHRKLIIDQSVEKASIIYAKSLTSNLEIQITPNPKNESTQRYLDRMTNQLYQDYPNGLFVQSGETLIGELKIHNASNTKTEITTDAVTFIMLNTKDYSEFLIQGHKIS